MDSLRNSSFLDHKLQLNLSRSVRIQSQLRSSAKESLPGDSRKSIFNPIGRPSRKNTVLVDEDTKMVKSIVRLLRGDPAIFEAISAFLSPEDLGKALEMKSVNASKRKEPSSRNRPRQARRIFKEGLLYQPNATGKEEEADIVDLFDSVQLCQEIAELKAEKLRLEQDISKSEFFANAKMSSSYHRFHYLLLKLKAVRKCAQVGKVSAMSTDYYTTVLDLRQNSQLKVQEETFYMDEVVEQVRTVSNGLIHGVETCFSAVDERINSDPLVQSSMDHQRLTQKTLDALATKLEEVVNHAKEVTSVLLQARHRREVRDSDKDGPVTAPKPSFPLLKVMDGSRANVELFKRDVNQVMERCLNMTESRLQRMHMSRSALLQDISSSNAERSVRHTAELLHSFEDNMTERSETVERMLQLEEQLRCGTERLFSDQARRLQGLYDQSEQVSINQLKAHYNTLYAKSPAKGRRRSAAHL